ncbi:MAG TPA: glycosyltransferase family 4 protein [Actinocrinis sp.]|jgi:colanic acid/amylovoran biosynthesis glycosyltransferase|nr:glycosyltransferase family 4 protein [Actinocrinis sp.]
MSYPLCVLTPEIGIISETFIQWDIEHLLPGRTVTVADPPPNGESVRKAPAWDISTPALRFAPEPGDPEPSPARQAQLRAFLTDHRVDLVLVEFLDFADRWFDCLKDTSVRIWLRGHGADLSTRLADPGRRETYRRYRDAHGILVPCHTAARRLTGLGLPADRIHVIPNHVDVPELRATAAHHDGLLHCLTAGRLVPKKGHLHTLAAFQQALATDDRLVLDIVGTGPLDEDLRHYVDHHRLTNHVRFHGPLPHHEVLAMIRRCDILLHHAVTAADGDRETQPLIILEALAAGTPVIATYHEGIPEVITNGVNGLLVTERAEQEMAEAIARLARSPAERTRLATEGWRTAHTAHSHHHVRPALLSLLDLPETTAP